MTTRKRILLITILLILPFSNYAWSEGSPSAIRRVDGLPLDPTDARGPVMPQEFAVFSKYAKSEIARQNATLASSFSRDPQQINYNSDGTISSVTYDGGVKWDYSYSYENGVMKSFSMTTTNIRITFKRAEGEGQDGILVEICLDIGLEQKRPEDHPLGGGYPPGKGGLGLPGDGIGGTGAGLPPPTIPIPPITPGTIKPDIVMYIPKARIEDFAAKPVKFDFKEIKKALEEASKEKEAAHEEYVSSTKPYYEKVCGKLKVKFKILNSEVDLGADLKGAIDGDVSGKAMRGIVDEAVARMRSAAGRDARALEATAEFLDVERGWRAEFLDPNKRLYEDRVQKAKDYINAMIDKLMNSELALYLGRNKEKIDVIINLPDKVSKDPVKRR